MILNLSMSPDHALYLYQILQNKKSKNFKEIERTRKTLQRVMISSKLRESNGSCSPYRRKKILLRS